MLLSPILLLSSTANTQGFPDTPARILIGGEYIYYRRKEDDRFLDVVRGYQGTTAIAHNPGDLILSQPEFTVLLSGGVNTILSEGSVAQSSVTEIEKTAQIQSVSEVIDTFTDINQLTKEIYLEEEVILERVDKQITIIPPTSYNVVTMFIPPVLEYPSAPLVSLMYSVSLVKL